MRDTSTGNRSISHLQFRPLLRLSPAALVVLYVAQAIPATGGQAPSKGWEPRSTSSERVGQVKAATPLAR